MEKRVFVIGDVHGCGHTLKELVLNLCDLQVSDSLYLLGDIIDRGPRIKFTVDFLLDLKSSGYDVNIVRGNHEQMLIDSLNQSKMLSHWYKNGGKDTLESFELLNTNYFDDIYIEFFLKMPFYFKTKEYIIVHSGLNFEVKDPLLDYKTMLWSRDTNVNKEKIGGRKLITGHTPRSLDTIKQSLTSDNVFLDGGCVYAKRIQGMGNLCAFEVNSKELLYLKNIDF